MKSASRVVVTGAAAYTCLGIGCGTFWHGLRAGHEPKAQIPARDALRRFPPCNDLARSTQKHKSDHPLATRLLAAIDQDLGGFLRRLSVDERQQTGVALGSAYGHLNSYFAYYQTGSEQGYQLVNPRHFPSTLPNFCTNEVNNTYSLWGSSTTVGTGWAAGLEAVGYGIAAVRRGEEQFVLAGGLEELNDYNQKMLEMAGLCSPSGFIRPFAADRDGTVPGEALAVLLLQPEESARRSSHRPLAQLCDTTNVPGVCWDTPGSLEKAADAIRRALDDAEVHPSDIDAIFPSANGTVAGDKFEEELLRKVFGNRLASITIFPLKSITGECFAASGPLQCLAAVYTVGLGAGGPVPTVGLPGNGIQVRLVEQISRRSRALVYSAGYDGTFSALVVRGLTT